MNDIKILIVEDDLLIAENLKATLEDLGYDVYEPCATAAEAIKTLEHQTFDLAMLDINLNGKDEGIEIGRLINTKYKFPFIFLTAFSDKETVQAATTAYPSAYLIKPTNAATLFATIQTAINNFQKSKIPNDATDELNDDSFFVKVGTSISKFYWQDVVYIASGKNYISIQLNKPNTAPVAIRSTLQYAMSNLIPGAFKQSFLQISRTHCINITTIKEVKNDFAITAFGSFEVGEKYKKNLMEKLNIL